MASMTWEQVWLPLWPLASDDLRHGIYRMDRASALGRRYVETNPHALSNLLVVDVDHPDALLRAVGGHHGWLPNAVVENPANGHAHAVWALKEPVTRTEYASRKATAYAAAVTEGLRRSVDGDKGYSGLITKNPEHDSWIASWFTDQLYELGHLATALAGNNYLPAPGWARTRRLDPVGLGRNCSIFETARHWAYRTARLIRQHNEYPTLADSTELHEAISRHVTALNLEFREPLPVSETRAISTSIHRWITTRFYGWTDARTVNEATFSTIQAARRRRGVAKQLVAREELRQALERASCLQ